MAKKFRKADIRKGLTAAISAGDTPAERERRKQLVEGEFGTTAKEAATQVGGPGRLFAAPGKLVQERGALQKKRKLSLSGQRSTRRSRTTPDLFASSLGSTKTLLGS